MRILLLENSPSPIDASDSGDSDDDDDDDGVDLDSDFYHYKDLVSCNPSFDWLLGALRSEAILQSTHTKVKDELRAVIMTKLRAPRHVSRRAATPAYHATFDLDWDPLAFVREQEYAEPATVVLKRAIVLNGSTDDAQALTVTDYLTQTWPAHGALVAELILRVASNPAIISHSKLLSR